MLAAGADEIDARGFDAGMAQHIGQLCDILLRVVKGSGEKMAQVVRKHLLAGHIRGGTKGFHLGPDLPAIHRAVRAREEDGAGNDALLPLILAELAAELRRHQDGARFAFEADLDAIDREGCGGDIANLRHADAGGGHQLQQQLQPGVPLPASRRDQPLILLIGQLALRRRKHAPLDGQRFHKAIRPMHIAKEAVERRQNGVHAAGGMVAEQRVLIGDSDSFGHHLIRWQPKVESLQSAVIFRYRYGASLLLAQILFVASDACLF